MNKRININDLYIGMEAKDEYSEYLEEYQLWEDHVLLEKTKYFLNLDNMSLEMYRNIETDQLLGIDEEGYVLNSKDELTREERYHKVTDIIRLSDLFSRYESDNRDNSQYRRYVAPLYSKVITYLRNKKTVTFSELDKIFGDLNDIHSYVFNIITEEEYEDLFGCKMYDFESNSRIRK